MKISITLIWDNIPAMTKELNGTMHPAMMWIRSYLRQIAYTNGADKMRIDTACVFGETHIEITHTDKWTMTYVEDEFFCDEAIEFETRGELIQFIKDIFTNLEQADKAEEEWGSW